MELGFAYGIANMVVPASGPKAIPLTLDFSATAQINIDSSQVIQNGVIEYLQGVFIDNSANATAFKLTMNGTGQIIVAPPNSQGYYMILCPNTPQLVANGTQAGGNVVNLIFYNVPMPPIVWKVT